jgi:hypothetical protein
MRRIVISLLFACFAQAADPDFTFVFIPDQHPFSPYDSTNAFKSVIAWIRTNAANSNIEGVFSSGDWVNGAQNVTTQLSTIWTHWSDSNNGIDTLVRNNGSPMPWIMAPGNHDYEGQFTSGSPCGNLNPNNACGIRDSSVFSTQLGYDRLATSLSKQYLESFWDFTETPASNAGPGKPK